MRRMEIRPGTRHAVFKAASRCLETRKRVVLSDPHEGPLAIKEAYKQWLVDWGQGRSVKLSFTPNDLAVFEYLEDE